MSPSSQQQYGALQPAPVQVSLAGAFIAPAEQQQQQVQWTQQVPAQQQQTQWSTTPMPTTVFFAGVTPVADSQRLRALFSQFGHVMDLNLFRPYNGCRTSKVGGCQAEER
jgi:hypothetical protein